MAPEKEKAAMRKEVQVPAHCADGADQANCSEVLHGPGKAASSHRTLKKQILHWMLVASARNDKVSKEPQNFAKGAKLYTTACGVSGKWLEAGHGGCKWRAVKRRGARGCIQVLRAAGHDELNQQIVGAIRLIAMGSTLQQDLLTIRKILQFASGEVRRRGWVVGAGYHQNRRAAAHGLIEAGGNGADVPDFTRALLRANAGIAFEGTGAGAAHGILGDKGNVFGAGHRQVQPELNVVRKTLGDRFDQTTEWNVISLIGALDNVWNVGRRSCVVESLAKTVGENLL